VRGVAVETIREPTVEGGAATSVAAELVALARDLWVLFKPGVMQLVLFTSLVALLLAPGARHPILSVAVMVALAGGAAASAAINNWYDSDIDRVMARTRRRPTAAGRVAPEEALVVGVVLAGLSVAVMGLAGGWLAASLLTATIAFYVLVYTIWLKRRTPRNIVIGGAAGALPPLVAWVAVSGTVDPLPLAMFLVIFLWTPPHFWALALYRVGDYAKVGVPMLPVVVGKERTATQISLYAGATGAASLVPLATGELGAVYGAAASLLAVRFVQLARHLRRTGSDVVANRLFRFSILYLFALFAAMLVDRAVANSVPAGW